MYQRQHVLLRRSERLQTESEMTQERLKVFKGTKEVISILGSLKVKRSNAFDAECEQFLDYSMMDYIRELNKQPSRSSTGTEFYCMLCHKRKPLQRSHIVPDAVLKKVHADDGQLYLMGPSRLSLECRARTIRTLTFFMLCNTCDNEVLSPNEKHFVESIVKPLYGTSPQGAHHLCYGEWLYSFCIGVVFRGLALTRGLTGSANKEEIYQLFQNCRSIIEKREPVSVPDIALFFTPYMADSEVPASKAKANLLRMLKSTVFYRLSNVPLMGSLPTLASQRHFFAAHFGIFTIVAFLEPVPSECRQFLINPNGGELKISCNDERLHLIPPGLLTMYNTQTLKSGRDFIERLVEADRKLPQGQEIKLTVVKSSAVNPEISQFIQSFSLLPRGFDINRETNSVTVKCGHRIILHQTRQQEQPSANHAVFLAIEETNPSKPYVIIDSFLGHSNADQAFGYYVSLPDYAFQSELDDKHKVIMKQLREKDLDLMKAPAVMLPIAFQRCGICNFQSVLYHLNR